MRCKYCDVNVDCQTDVCPLCHEKLEASEIGKICYPPKKPIEKRKIKNFSVGSIYAFCATVISVLSVVVNLIVDSDTLWSLPVAAILFYGILIIKNTVPSNQSAALKIFWHEAYLFGVCLLVQYLFAVENFVYEYALPMISVFAVIAMAIFLLCARKHVKQHLWGAVGLCLYGFISIILYTANVNIVLWPSLTAALFSTVSLLALVIFGRRALGREFERKFHI